MGDNIDRILESRRQKTAQGEVPAAPPAEEEGSKFYSLLNGDVLDDPFLELRFRDGLKLCFPYRDVVWISYDPKGPDIKIDFGSTIISINGRGLGDRLFAGLKQKRVVWLKEADSEMQDHDGNEVFITDIGFESTAEETAAE